MAKSRENENWNREEHILAFNLYSQIPFGTIHMGNPKLQQLAKILGRSPGSISYKLSNFARLDPSLKARGIRGNEHGAKGEEQVWNEFATDPEGLAFESERLLASRLGVRVEEVAEIDETDLPPAGKEREGIVRVRVNQSFFRRRIVSIYKFQCCVTGLSIRELLVASHIIPWAKDAGNRLNPRNGLCLNALHDRAFDRGLMYIDENFVIRFSAKLTLNSVKGDTSLAWLKSFEGSQLRLPDKFAPDPALLLKHARTNFCIRK